MAAWRIKRKAAIDLWAKENAPSTELRKSYHGKEIDFAEFRKKYAAELAKNPETQKFLEEIKKHKKITLLTSVKEIGTSELPVLKEFIEKMLIKQPKKFRQKLTEFYKFKC